MTRRAPIPETVTLQVPFRVVRRGGRKEMHLPAGAAQQRMQRHVLPGGQQRPHPLFRLPRQRHQRRAEEIDLAVGDGADDEAGGEIAAQAQMLDQRRMLVHVHVLDQRQRRLHASVTHDPLGPRRAHQGKHQRRTFQGLPELDQKHVPAIRRQPRVGDQRLPQGRQVTVALGHAAVAERGDRSAAIGEQGRARLLVADLGNGRRQRHGNGRAAGNQHLRRLLADGHPVDQVGIGQEWRTSQHEGCHFRLVGSERRDHLDRRVMAHGQGLRHGLANLGGRIVEQQRQRGFRRAAILERKSGPDIGMGKGARRCRPLRDPRGVYPFQEMRNDRHAHATLPNPGRR